MLRHSTTTCAHTGSEGPAEEQGLASAELNAWWALGRPSVRQAYRLPLRCLLLTILCSVPAMAYLMALRCQALAHPEPDPCRPAGQ